MRTRPLLLLIPLWASAQSALALPASLRALDRPPRDEHVVEHRETRQDTVWLGGNDGNCLAHEDGVWDWDTEISPDDSLQCWTAVDLTRDRQTYFTYADIDSFPAHGDPCTPIYDAGLLWCGVHQDQADQLGFVHGMGYGNEMCQLATSPILTVPDGSEIETVSFVCFVDLEEDFDFAHLYFLRYDAAHEVIEEYLVASFTGAAGSFPYSPLHNLLPVPGASCSGGSCYWGFEFRVESDGSVSDEDGDYDSVCGPFGVDDFEIRLRIGGDIVYVAYDFNDGLEGWTLDRCPGAGVFVDAVPEQTYFEWLMEAQDFGTCALSGNVLSFVDQDVPPDSLPGLPPGSRQRAISGAVPRGGFTLPDWNSTLIRWSQFVRAGESSGVFYRPGYMYYPYSTEQAPEERWSPRQGPDVFYQPGEEPCERLLLELLPFGEPTENPLPPDWDSLRVVFDVYASCDYFGIPGSLCTEEGMSFGSPLIDNVQVGMTHSPDAPPIERTPGHLFHDGFGQSFPTYLEPTDRGNANVAVDLSGDEPGANSWLADSAVVTGPHVHADSSRWLVNLCLKVLRKGPRQDLVPGYHAWKMRLGGDPEVDHVCVLMDSVEAPGGGEGRSHQFATYFHETSPGYDPAYPDLSPEQEILPDDVFVPGTQIQYSFAGFWYRDGSPPEEYRVIGPWEFEILPRMSTVEGWEYRVSWPAVLYVDAYNAGAERYITAAFAEDSIRVDTYDYLYAESAFNAPMKRSFGGTGHNPGGWGNNGCTLEQLLGYRLILVNTGSLAPGAMEPEDFELFADWLAETQCNLLDVRRGLLLNGDRIAGIIEHHDPLFLEDVLGVSPPPEPNVPRWAVPNYYPYRIIGVEYCVFLEYDGDDGRIERFDPLEPGVRLYGNTIHWYSVLGITPDLPGTVGNLSYAEDSLVVTYTHFAQVLRNNIVPGEANWKSAVDGYSLHHVADRDCGAETCSDDSVCIVQGIRNLLDPTLTWILDDPLDTFAPWGGPCALTAVDEEAENHLTGPVDYLYPTLPNPFNRRANVRFQLRRAGEVTVAVYDVTGREVHRLVDGKLEAGEHAYVWDGSSTRGPSLGSGVYWIQMRTGGGYTSSKRIVFLQ